VVSGIQAKLFELIKHSLREDEFMRLVVSDLLSLSTDEVYRRIRQETLLTIEELRKLCIHFDISFDSLMEMKAGSAVFSYLNLKEGQFTVEKYLEGILNDHYMPQVEVVKKYIFGNEQPSDGNELKVYLTGTVNTDSTILYETSKASGVYLTHNIMNYLHTVDEEYVTDSKRILQRQIENSSQLSEVNAKQRIQYFRSMNQLAGKYKQRFEQIINNAHP
jgi:hypothetical protein